MKNKKIKIFLIMGVMSLSGTSLSEVDIDDCSDNQNKNLNKLYEKISKLECKAKGAWFYKIEQENPDDSLGVSATFDLPKFEHDPKRYFTNPANVLPPHTVGPLDRASVYLGGQIGGTELDAGLTWDKVYGPDGKPVIDKHTKKEKFAFRPFWRATEGLKSDTVWHNPDLTEDSKNKRLKKMTPDQIIKNNFINQTCTNSIREDETYCKNENVSFENPGNEMRMELKIIDNLKDKLKIENRSVVKMKIVDVKSKKCFVTCFEHLRKSGNNQNSWKRVSSIDQFTLGPCYIAKNGNVTSTKSKDIKVDSKNNYIPFKYKKKINGIDSEVITGVHDCRPSREGQKANVLGTSAKLENMNWKRVELLKKDKNPTPLNSQNSRKILGEEFCKDKTNLKEKDHFIDLSRGID